MEITPSPGPLSSLLLSALLFPHCSFCFFFSFLSSKEGSLRLALTALAVCLSYAAVFSPYFLRKSVASALGHRSQRDGNTTQYADSITLQYHRIEAGGRAREREEYRRRRRDELVGKQLIASKLNFPLYCTAT